jgi:hypothetical protein
MEPRDLEIQRQISLFLRENWHPGINEWQHIIDPLELERILDNGEI